MYNHWLQKGVKYFTHAHNGVWKYFWSCNIPMFMDTPIPGKICDCSVSCTNSWQIVTATKCT